MIVTDVASISFSVVIRPRAVTRSGFGRRGIFFLGGPAVGRGIGPFAAAISDGDEERAARRRRGSARRQTSQQGPQIAQKSPRLFPHQTRKISRTG